MTKKGKAKPVVVQIERWDGSKVEGVFDSSVTEWLDGRLKEIKKKEADQDGG